MLMNIQVMLVLTVVPYGRLYGLYRQASGASQASGKPAGQAKPSYDYPDYIGTPRYVDCIGYAMCVAFTMVVVVVGQCPVYMIHSALPIVPIVPFRFAVAYRASVQYAVSTCVYYILDTGPGCSGCRGQREGVVVMLMVIRVMGTGLVRLYHLYQSEGGGGSNPE